MSTGDRFVHVANKRILGLTDLREGFLDYLRETIRDVHRVSYGLDGVFGGTPITITAFGGAGRFQLSANHPLTGDGEGHFLQTNTQLAGRDIGIAFENTAAAIYYVALHHALRPREVQINPRTGFPEFVSWEETIGVSDVPNTVTDNGNGTITFRIDTVCEPFGGAVDTHAGRIALVWKNQPGRTALTELAAVESLVVAFVAGQNRITSAGLFGQAADDVSVNAADYTVLLLGPTVSSSTDLEGEVGYMFVGTVTGAGGTTPPTVFDTSNQNDLSSGFAVDLNEITRIANGDLKIRVRAVVADTNEPQIEAQDSGGATVFSVDEDGDGFFAGDLDVDGDGTFQTITVVDLSVTGDAIIGNQETDAHEIHGSVLSENDSAEVNINVSGTDPEVGIGIAFQNNIALRTAGGAGGRVDLGTDDTAIHHLRGEVRGRNNGAGNLWAARSSDGRGAFGGAIDATRMLRVHGNAEIDGDLSLGRDLNTEALAMTPRIDHAPGGQLDTGALLHALRQWQGRSDARRVTEVALTTTDGFGWLFNANYDPMTELFSKQVNGQTATLILIQEGGSIFIRTRAATANATWNFADFDRGLYLDYRTLSFAEPIGVATAADAARFRMQFVYGRITGANPTVTGLLSMLVASGTRAGLRVWYQAEDGAGGITGLCISHNAAPSDNGTVYTPDDVSKPSFLLNLSADSPGASTTARFNIYWRQPLGVPGTFSIALWHLMFGLTSPSGVGGGQTRMDWQVGNAGLTFNGVNAEGGNPGPSVALLNQLVPKSMGKGWALIAISTGILTGTNGVVDGANVASVTLDAGPGELVVTLAAPMASSTWAPSAKESAVGAANFSGATKYVCWTTSSTVARIRAVNSSTGVVQDIAAGTHSLLFEAKGAMTS